MIWNWIVLHTSSSSSAYAETAYRKIKSPLHSGKFAVPLTEYPSRTRDKSITTLLAHQPDLSHSHGSAITNTSEKGEGSEQLHPSNDLWRRAFTHPKGTFPDKSHLQLIAPKVLHLRL